MAPASAAKRNTAPLPSERPYPAVLDAPIEYEGMTTCDPTPRPGALMLRKLLLETYGEAVIGISRACHLDSISEHKEGRAVDWMVDWKDPKEFAEAQTFIDWLTGPGPDGTPAANARRLGIMYIGWADEMWRAYDTGRGWTELKGCYSLQSSGYDTFCHRDHVHFSMTWDGAAGRTSYWDQTPVLDQPCPTVRASGRAKALRASAAFTPIKPVRVFDSRKRGENGCYLQQRRWSGDDRSLPIRIAGRKGIPETGLQAAALRITAYASNAPGWLTVSGSPGSNGPRAVSLGMDGSSAATVIAPVSDTGRIWLSTVAGHARVAVDVLGYFARGASTAAGERVGTWRPVPGEVAAKATLPAKGTATLSLNGAPEDATGVAMTLNTDSDAKGHVRVMPPGAKTKSDAVAVAEAPSSGAVFAASSNGKVTLRNTSTAPTAVSLLVTGWISKPTTTSGRLKPLVRELGEVKTTRKVKVLTPLVPKKAKALVLSVTTKGYRKPGGLTVWGDGAAPAARSIDVRRKRTHTDLVIVTLGADRMLRAAGDAPKGTASIRLVGIIR